MLIRISLTSSKIRFTIPSLQWMGKYLHKLPWPKSKPKKKTSNFYHYWYYCDVKFIDKVSGTIAAVGNLDGYGFNSCQALGSFLSDFPPKSFLCYEILKMLPGAKRLFPHTSRLFLHSPTDGTARIFGYNFFLPSYAATRNPTQGSRAAAPRGTF